ncbi:hypothetical protein BMS3Bbin02_01765 [bacterium BMS3Bbin02]|nr:hypothetical protein BMS3Bbin02_01765 [bacterium BMS3Bbin02]
MALARPVTPPVVGSRTAVPSAPELTTTSRLGGNAGTPGPALPALRNRPAQSCFPNAMVAGPPSLRTYWGFPPVPIIRLLRISMLSLPLDPPDASLPFWNRKIAKVDWVMIVLLYTLAPFTPRISMAESSKSTMMLLRAIWFTPSHAG